jgi:hypothetical protein
MKKLSEMKARVTTDYAGYVVVTIRRELLNQLTELRLGSRVGMAFIPSMRRIVIYKDYFSDKKIKIHSSKNHYYDIVCSPKDSPKDWTFPYLIGTDSVEFHWQHIVIRF